MRSLSYSGTFVVALADSVMVTSKDTA